MNKTKTNSNNEKIPDGSKPNLIDIIDLDDNSYLIVCGCLSSTQPEIYSSNVKIKDVQWFRGNGLLIEINFFDRKNKKISIDFIWPGEKETIKISCFLFRMFLCRNMSESKRHIANGVIVLKQSGLRKGINTIRSYFTVNDNLNYSKWLKEKGLDKVKSITQFQNDKYRWVNCDGSELIYDGTEHIVDSMLKEKYRNRDFPSIIYSDEDELSSGEFRNPKLKPDFDQVLFENTEYLDGPVLIRWDIRVNEKKLKEFILKEGDKGKVHHIPGVLLHRSVKQNIEESDDKLGICDSETDENKQKDKISIIIPNKDHVEDLRCCIDSIKSNSTYRNYEVIIVENNSTDNSTFSYYDEIIGEENIKVIKYPGAFNYSAINNYAASQASGDFLLLLNNDTKIVNPDSIVNMHKLSKRLDAGAVGAKLLYPDGTIQHAGVYIGVNGIADHVWKGYPSDAFVNMNSLNVEHQVSAITGACLMVKKSLFDKFGGLNEDLEVAFNDIDFCLRLQEAGYKNIYTPGAVLTHYESVSRGADLTPDKWRRFRRETGYMRARWNRILTEGDPFYNVNLTCIGTEGTLKKKYED